MQRIDILLFEAFSNHCLANTVEPLRAANGLAKREIYRWRVLTLDGGPVESSSGLRIAAHEALSQVSGDLLIAMPSYRFRDHADVVTRRGLRAAAGRYGALAGFDTGSWLLADAGLLNGRRATIHWEEFERFSEAFPDVLVMRERFVRDGNRISSSGALAAFDVILEMIGQTHGQALRLEVATLFMSAEATAGPGGPVSRSRSVGRAVAAMQANLETPLSIAQLARKSGLGQRRLEDRMRAEFGATPQAIYRRLRLTHARKLVQESDMPVAEVALRSGYQDASAMTRAFKAEFAITPRDLRREA
jgi:transcriptional regulator GlxA family with amidase domain